MMTKRSSTQITKQSYRLINKKRKDILNLAKSSKKLKLTKTKKKLLNLEKKYSG